MGAITNADLLVLDDMGSEFPTSFYEMVTYNIINTRINLGLPTIISTNLSLEELDKRYNDRIVSRIIGTYNILCFVGEDNRSVKRIGR